MIKRWIAKLGVMSLLMIIFVAPAYAEEMNIKTEQKDTGILLNDGYSGEIYGGLRWKGFGFEDKNQWLSLRAGNGGLRIVTNDNKQELLAADNFGGIYINGDLYYNGKAIKSIVSEQSVNNLLYIIISCLLLIICVFSFMFLKLRKQLKDIETRMKFGSNE